MPEPSRTSHAHRSHSHSRKSSFRRNIRNGYWDPAFYFSGAVLLFVFAKLLHADLLSAALGAMGIILLAISKIWKYKPGVLISIVCIFAMTMAFVWQWVDRYFIAVLTSEITTNPTLFRSGLAGGMILALMVWIYQRHLNSIHIRMSQKWFVKKSYVTIFKLLFYFQLFLFLFWAIVFLVQKAHPVTNLNPQDATIIAGALALLAAGLPAIVYLAKGSPDEKKGHLPGHRHRHHMNSRYKNTDPGEK
jgi:hypothetical protein